MTHCLGFVHCLICLIRLLETTQLDLRLEHLDWGCGSLASNPEMPAYRTNIITSGCIFLSLSPFIFHFLFRIFLIPFICLLLWPLYTLMTEPQSYALHHLSGSASDRHLPDASSARISQESVMNDSRKNVFSDEYPKNVAKHSTHPNDPASADSLLSTSRRDSFYVNFFTNGWGWEVAAWALVATSLVALLAVFAAYVNKPLRQWDSAVTPGAVVAVLSQVGQTAAVVPVAACICQSMWLSLAHKSGLGQRTEQVDRPSRLINMQNYFDGSRGPLGSLRLVYKHPRSYEKPPLFI